MQISEKFWKCPLLKNQDTKVVHHFEENDYLGDDLHSNRNKSISLFIDYERLKSPPPFTVHFYQLPDPDVLDLGLKIYVKI